MRRRRVWVGGLIAVLALVGVVGVVLVRQDDELPPVVWRLGSVSADARTIGIWHEVPSCTREPGPVRVDERAGSVSITVTQRKADVSDDFICDVVLRSRMTRVHLREFVRFEAEIPSQVLRVDLERGVRRPARMWLIPGPERSCLFVLFSRFDAEDSACASSARLARHGMYLARSCVTRRQHGQRRRELAGVVPAGVTRVRLLRHRRIVGQAAVSDGTWSTRSRQPDEITYAKTHLPVSPQTSRCE